MATTATIERPGRRGPGAGVKLGGFELRCLDVGPWARVDGHDGHVPAGPGAPAHETSWSGGGGRGPWPMSPRSPTTRVTSSWLSFALEIRSRTHAGSPSSPTRPSGEVPSTGATEGALGKLTRCIP